MAEEREERSPRELLEEAIDAHLRHLPPRYALSSILRTLWGRPEFVKLREELSERSKELSEQYRAAAKEAGLAERYRTAAERAKIREKFSEIWRH